MSFFSYETLLLIPCRWVCHKLFKSLQKIIDSLELKSLFITPWASQFGQLLSCPPSPQNHSMMHMLQPMSTLQHLVAMTGGVIGALRHILHLNASETNLITQGGRGRNLLTSISSCSIVLHSSKVELLFCSSSLSILVSSFISFTSCLTNLSAFFLFRSTLLSSKFFVRARFTLMVSLGCFCFCSFFVFYGKNYSTWALPEV